MSGGSGDVALQASLEHTTTVFTRHGNAAQVAWSDDGKAVFIANEEGVMSAVKIDAAEPTNPQLVASKGEVNFLWAAAQRNGLLVFHPSLGDTTLAADPATLATRWQKRTGSAHAIATDGSRVFVPAEGRPAALIVLGPDGQEITRVPEADGWWRVHTAAYDDSTRRLYVGAGDNVAEGYAGGTYVYDVSGSPVKLGVIPGASSDIAARGSWLWRGTGNGIDVWNVSNPSRAVRVGGWQGSSEQGPGGTPVRPQIGPLVVRRDTSRLYVTYRSVTVTGGHPVADWDAGFMIFDVAGGEPEFMSRHGWKTDIGQWVQPLSLALSPDQATLVVSYWAFGVRFFRVTGDRVADQGMVATTGEAHDVYADGFGFLYVFANDDIQIIDERTGKHVGVYVSGSGFDGQWRPFKDGTVILPSARNAHGRLVLRMENGRVELVASLGGAASTWDEVFDEPFLYSATDRGLAVQQVGAYDPATRRYPLTVHPSVDVGGALLAITKFGDLVWGVGPSVGVVAIDVSAPRAARIVFRDSFTFGVNGNHAGIIAARGRIYAGAGDAGLIVYEAANRRRTGPPITGLNVNFLDKVGEDFLIVANYWFTRVLEGMVIYDLRASPDAPRQIQIFPGDGPNANFRARVFGTRIYRVPLYGIDVLDLR